MAQASKNFYSGRTVRLFLVITSSQLGDALCKPLLICEILAVTRTEISACKPREK